MQLRGPLNFINRVSQFFFSPPKYPRMHALKDVIVKVHFIIPRNPTNFIRSLIR